jgi:ketosteroid isomerase-like protein
MSAAGDVRVIRQLSDASGRGDVESILAALTGDVDRIASVGGPPPGPRAGRRLLPPARRDAPLASQGGRGHSCRWRVVVEGRNRNTARATGRPYEHQWVMVFTIRDD